MTSGYSIHVVGRHVLVTEAIKNYALEKVGKIEKFTDRIVDVTVTLDIQRMEQRCEISMSVGNLKIFSHAATQDMYASIEQAVRKLERQLRRYKSKLQEHHAKSLNAIDMEVNVYEAPYDEVEEFNEEIEAQNVLTFPKVVAQEQMPLKRLTLVEAIRDLDLSQDPFLIYMSEEEQALKVLYWRDGKETLGLVSVG